MNNKRKQYISFIANNDKSKNLVNEHIFIYLLFTLLKFKFKWPGPSFADKLRSCF